MQTQPFSKKTPMFPLAVKVTFTAEAFAVDASANFYQTADPLVAVDETVGEAAVFATSSNAAADDTADEEGLLLPAGVFRFDLSAIVGDANNNAGEAGSCQLAVITKDTADSSGLIMLSPIMPTVAVANSELSDINAADVRFTDTAFFELSAPTVVQLVGRTVTGTLIGLKWGTLSVVKVGNVGSLNA